MKRLAFVVSVLTLGCIAATPARADFAVVRFDNGYCRIWWDASGTPWGAGWTKIAMAPDWMSAQSALDAAIARHACN